MILDPQFNKSYTENHLHIFVFAFLRLKEVKKHIFESILFQNLTLIILLREAGRPLRGGGGVRACTLKKKTFLKL